MQPTMMYIPSELIFQIIAFILYTPPNGSEEPGIPPKQPWSLIEPLTLASKAYRILALTAWFRTLFIKDPMDIVALQDLFPEIGATWTKELHCVQINSRKSSVWDLHPFKCLFKIRLDWLAPFMMPHYSSQDPADRLPFMHVSPRVVELDIRGLPWPAPLVFHNIDGIFPNLNVLKLRQPRIWCGLCHTCSVARFRAPGPEKIVYQGGLGLPMHYARAFQCLRYLHTISITLADFGGGRTTLSDDSEHNQYLWAGECDRCMEVMYEDEAFRDRWMARKKGYGGPGIVYVAPPALTRVEWKFWKAESDEDPDMQESGDEISSGEDV